MAITLLKLPRFSTTNQNNVRKCVKKATRTKDCETVVQLCTNISKKVYSTHSETFSQSVNQIKEFFRETHLLLLLGGQTRQLSTNHIRPVVCIHVCFVFSVRSLVPASLRQQISKFLCSSVFAPSFSVLLC